MTEALFDNLQVVHGPDRVVIDDKPLPIYHLDKPNNDRYFSLTTYSLSGKLNRELGGGWFTVQPNNQTHIYMLDEGQILQGEASWGSGWILGFQPGEGKIIKEIKRGDGQKFIFTGKGSSFCFLSDPAESLTFQFLTKPFIKLHSVSGMWNTEDLEQIGRETRLELDEFIAQHVK